MKRSLKALLAIAASSATTIAFAAPSAAALLGEGDSATFTGVYSRRLELTRSCSITARPTSDDVNAALQGIPSGGTTIRLTRKAGSDDATGSVKIDFESAGANAVYFDDDKFRVVRFDGEQFTDEGSGKVTVRAEKKTPRFSRALFNELEDAADDGGVDVDEPKNDKILAEISGGTKSIEGNTPGFVLGGFSSENVKGGEQRLLQGKSVSALSDGFSKPETTSAILTMSIDDVKELEGQEAIIQAQLVCTPIGIDDEGNNTLRPILEN